MLGKFISKLFGSKKESRATAKSRLSFVLVQDRTGLTNEEMTEFRSEMVKVIGRYFVIDEQGFDIDYKRDGETTTLFINSPVVVKRQEALNGITGARARSVDGGAKPNGAKQTRRKRRKRNQQQDTNLTANV